MFKKMLIPTLSVFMIMLCSFNTATPTLLFDGPDPPPDRDEVLIGNWNNEMDPHNCVLLDIYRLSIKVVITVGSLDFDLYQDLYYRTSFYGGSVSGGFGPLLSDDFIVDTLSNGGIVYRFTNVVYKNTFDLECQANPDNPIPFDYNISLVDENNAPYDLLANIGLVTYDIPGSLPQQLQLVTVYEGTKSLCCYPGVGSSYSQNNEYSIEQGRAQNTPTILPTTPAIELNESTSSLNDITVSPNPFNTTLNLHFESTKKQSVDLQIWSADGRLVHSSKHVCHDKGQQNIQIDTELFDNGFYYGRIYSPDHSDSFKILKMK